MENKDGFLVINKDKGCTSHDCVKQIRKLLNIKVNAEKISRVGKYRSSD